MPQPRIAQIVSLVFSLASLGLFVLFFVVHNAPQRVELSVLAAGIGFAAMLSPLAKPSKTQTLIALLAAVLAGLPILLKSLVLEMPITHLGASAALLVSFILFFMAQNGRLLLYEKINRTSKLWFEPFLAASGWLLFIGYNLVAASDWQLSLSLAIIPVVGSLQTIIVQTDFNRMKRAAEKAFVAVVGDPAPDFSLPDEKGEKVSLSRFRGQRHVLLFFYRGDWCPYCNMMLRAYAREAHLFKQKNILLMAVGPDDPSTNRALVERLNLDYMVLSDPELIVAQQYGIQIKDYNPSMKKAFAESGSPLPASFLVDKEGILRFTSHPSRVGEYLNPSLISNALEKL